MWNSVPESEMVDDFLLIAERVAAEKANKRDANIISRVSSLVVPKFWGEEETRRVFWEKRESQDEKVTITGETLIQIPHNMLPTYTARKSFIWPKSDIKIWDRTCVPLSDFQDLMERHRDRNLWGNNFILYNSESHDEIHRWDWKDSSFVQWWIFKRLEEVLKFSLEWEIYLK